MTLDEFESEVASLESGSPSDEEIRDLTQRIVGTSWPTPQQADAAQALVLRLSVLRAGRSPPPDAPP